MDRTVCVKVEGRGTFQNSPGLKEFVKQMIQRGYREFVVDLKDCELMDSTFMGTLAGAALRLREIGQGSLEVTHANERNNGLLTGLGLDQLFKVSEGGPSSPVLRNSQLVEAPAPAASEESQKEVVLQAHEALAAADESNAMKFRDVLEFLRQDLNTGNNDES
jgi:anti-sigma B factor antagonist